MFSPRLVALPCLGNVRMWLQSRSLVHRGRKLEHQAPGQHLPTRAALFSQKAKRKVQAHACTGVLLHRELCSCPARKGMGQRILQEFRGPLDLEGRGSRGQKFWLVLCFIRSIAPQVRLPKAEHHFWSWHSTARLKTGGPRWDQEFLSGVKIFMWIHLQIYVE